MPATDMKGQRGWKDEQDRKKGCLDVILLFLLPIILFGIIKIVGG